ncbi:MAG: hypothetical protein ACE362_24360 [Phaeodactylibacter xiamenensis]|uniref:hypothetical protein n=1 Tax=Phaeodactylibacter xiamenensis TaxID=1524460 RepID=UPI001269F755|nr:hypothetical protein [Phaeodactylibacter xiamenensis]MCR9053269.1 hypothetical protein [bacterium]
MKSKQFIGSLPSAGVEGPNNICLGDTVNLIANGGVNYEWNDGSQDAVIQVVPLPGEQYVVTVTGSNGCTRAIPHQYTLHPLPVTSNISGNEEPAIGASGLNYSVANSPGYFYHWIIEGGLFQSGYGTSEVEVVWTSEEEGWIGVFATDENGCTGDTTFLAVDIQSSFQQSTPLETEWNLISTYLALDDYSAAAVFDHLNPLLNQVKDQSTTFYPDFPQFSTLTSLEDGKGYWVNMAASQPVIFNGIPLDPTTTVIQLEEGWNLIGYTASEPQGVEEAFASIISILEKVKDINESYDPNIDPAFNTLETIQPGKGYWVRVSQAVDFTYPDPGGMLAGGQVEKSKETPPQTSPAMQQLSHQSKWTVKSYPNSTIAYGNVTLNGMPVTDGGIIGAFVNGECRALGEVRLTDEMSHTSLVINGLPPEEVTFRLLKNGKTWTSQYQAMTRPGNPFKELLPLDFGSPSNISEKTHELAVEVFPNPFSNELSVAMELSLASTVELTFSNAAGKVLFQKLMPIQPSGLFRYTCNPENIPLPIGLININIKTDYGETTQRVVRH